MEKKLWVFREKRHRAGGIGKKNGKKDNWDTDLII